MHEFGAVRLFRVAELSGVPPRQEVITAHLHVVSGGVIEDGTALGIREIVDFLLDLSRVVGHAVLSFNIAEIGCWTSTP